MKIVVTALFAITLMINIMQTVNAETVKGHYRKNGTYVQPYNRTTRNHTNIDNYSYNPRTDTPKYYNTPSYTPPSRPSNALLSIPSVNTETVEGHYRKNGTYVQPYNRTTRNHTNIDNYSYNSRTDTPKYYNTPSYTPPSRPSNALLPIPLSTIPSNTIPVNIIPANSSPTALHLKR